MSKPRIIQHPNASERRAAFDLRRRVFTEEQGVAPSIERDGLDDQADHVVLMQGDKAIATGRMIQRGGTVKMQRIAVDKAHRGQGLGRQVMDALEDLARHHAATEALLASQVSALTFYLRLGYEVFGEPFVDANIDHRWMRKDL
jgi:predicted GNAT family N-acyltransferase